MRFQGSGTKPPRLNDCAFEVKQRNGNSASVAVVTWLSLGGIEWNSYYQGLASSGTDGVGPLIKSNPGNLHMETVPARHREQWRTGIIGDRDTPGHGALVSRRVVLCANHDLLTCRDPTGPGA